MRSLCLAVVAILALARRPAAAVAAATSTPTPPQTPPVTGQTGDEVPPAGPPLGFPVFATKNTTRVAGGDAIADAAGDRARHLSRAHARVAPGRGDPGRGARLAHRARRRRCSAARPIRAPILFADGDTDPGRDQGRAGRAAADRLQGGGRGAGHPRRDEGAGRGLQDDRHRRPPTRRRWPPPSTALQTAAAGAPSGAVIVASVDRPGVRDARRRLGGQVRRPAAVGHRDRHPAGDRGGDQDAQVGRRSTCSGRPTRCPDTVLDALEKLGTVKRIAGTDPVTTAITFARFKDGNFGWYVVDPGPRAGVRLHAPPAGRRRGRAAVGLGHLRPAAAAHRRRRAARSRCRTTCSTSSPATTPTRSAASTTTAGSSATRARSPPPCRRA